MRARDRHGKTEVATIERERARIRKLEEANASARDRVAWALDSLQNVLDGRR